MFAIGAAQFRLLQKSRRNHWSYMEWTEAFPFRVLFLFSRISGLTVFLSFSFIEFLIQINKLNKIKTNKHKIKDKKAQNSTLTKCMQTTKKAKKNFKYSILEFGA